MPEFFVATYNPYVQTFAILHLLLLVEKSVYRKASDALLLRINLQKTPRIKSR
jgi:hypothetical protein